MNLLLQRLQLLKQKGFSPTVVYDLGAFVGAWTTEVRALYPDATFCIFEANQIHEESLKRCSDRVFIGVLGAENKQVPFYSRSDCGDSVFLENTSHFIDNDNVDISERQVFRLDDLVEEKSFPSPNLVKIDLQGSELEALKGGLKILTLAEIIIIEVKVLEYNIGAPKFLETIQFMDSIGYQVLDLTELHYLHTGELNEIDLMFCKKNSSYYKTGLLQ